MKNIRRCTTESMKRMCTLWLRVSSIMYRGNSQIKPKKPIDWSLSHSLDSGILSEQVHPETAIVVGVLLR
ncbi:MAG: hypothetical protein R3B12_02955 [Candidatus Saccharimonadales bacterium]